MRLMVVLCFVASGVGVEAWAQIPAVVTLAVNDGRRVELKDSAGFVHRPLDYDPKNPPVSTGPPQVRVVRGHPGYEPVAEALAKSEPSTLLRADKSYVVEMSMRFAVPAVTLNEACASRGHSPNLMSTLTPNPEDVAKVMAWLTSVGFTDVKAYKADIFNRAISFKGTVDVIEQAFRTQVYSYTLNHPDALLPADRYTTYYTNGTNLSVPEAFGGVIGKVIGLSPVSMGGICDGIKAEP